MKWTAIKNYIKFCKKGCSMRKRISLFLLGFLLLTTPLLAQDKVDVVALKNGINSGTITVGVTATAIPTTALAGRRSIIIVNISANTIYLGNSGVTTATGYALYTTQAVSMDIGSEVTIYGIAGGASEIRYLEAR